MSPSAMSLNTITDAASAIQRLSAVFEAEVLEETHITEPDLPNAIEVRDAAFTWDNPPPEAHKKKQRKRHSKEVRHSQIGSPAVPEKPKSEDDNIFKMEDVNLLIRREQLVAIVGPVGSGKTSLLQGIIGEMRKTAGSVRFGGTVAYCPQVAWIQVRFPFTNIILRSPGLMVLSD